MQSYYGSTVILQRLMLCWLNSNFIEMISTRLDWIEVYEVCKITFVKEFGIPKLRSVDLTCASYTNSKQHILYSGIAITSPSEEALEPSLAWGVSQSS